eukprot:jgi/Tetstr1/454688/TSEL_041577.t1
MSSSLGSGVLASQLTVRHSGFVVLAGFNWRRPAAKRFAVATAARCDGNAAADSSRRAALRSGAVAAALLMSRAAEAASNTAILRDIQKYQDKDSAFSLEEQEVAGRDRLLGAQAQLAQVGRLAASGRYNDARLQLREGPMRRVRADLRAAEQEFDGLRKDTGDSLVSAIEALDQGLKAQLPPDELGKLLEGVSAAVDAVQAELVLPDSP